MPSPVYVYAEYDAKGLRKASRQVLTVAHKLAGGGDVVAIVVGGADASAAAGAGVSSVLKVDAPALAKYTAWAYAKAIAAAVESAGPGPVLLGCTSQGKELAPMVAQRLGMPLLADVTDMKGEGDAAQFVRPIYAGKALRTVKSAQPNYVVTVRPNAFPDHAGDGAAEVKNVDVAFDDADARVTVESVEVKASERPDLTEAEYIVSGGVAVASADGFKPVEAVADALGAAVGASRAAVNAGYIDVSHQVGQTGKTVGPQLYVALGISGAIQHLAGMSTSKCIVAVNTDEEAPIFKIADYGIVADLFEIAPLLAEEIKKAKA
ncbi:MAG: electron transfer flavoprotein subunit alpha/FixB family protein [Phycisphaerae bacterium]|nr:electron transfer flavoprotein subunit alpha/FixB family protein [Phycisphaerae bacterium]